MVEVDLLGLLPDEVFACLVKGASVDVDPLDRARIGRSVESPDVAAILARQSG